MYLKLTKSWNSKGTKSQKLSLPDKTTKASYVLTAAYVVYDVRKRTRAQNVCNS